MSLSNEDISQVREVVVDAITTAIQELVLPRFDEHDKRLSAIERDVAELKSDVRVLKADMRDVKASLGRLEGRLEALEADVKELYVMLKEHKRAGLGSKEFNQLPIEKKVLQMYENVKLLAQEAGVALPD